MKPALPVPVYHVRFRYPHHAGPSGYDRLADYVGEAVPLSEGMRFLGETLFRIPAKLTAWYGGHFEYSRHDFVMEMQAGAHMMKHRRCIYHFLYGEKSFKLLAHVHGLRGHRMVATFHHPPEHYAWLFRSSRHLAQLDHAITVSTNQVAFLENLVGPGRVTFVPYGVDTEWFSPGPKPAANRPPRCLFVGHHMRDFDALPAVVAGLMDAVRDLEFIIISSDRRSEKALVNARAQWLRHVSDAEYLAHMRSADLLVLPMKGSTTVTSVLEAMACGVPVITNPGGVSDYISDPCAVTVPTGDAESMTAAALDLLKSPHKRAEMSAAARSRALEFSWPRVAEQTAVVYRRIAEGM